MQMLYCTWVSNTINKENWRFGIVSVKKSHLQSVTFVYHLQRPNTLVGFVCYYLLKSVWQTDRSSEPPKLLTRSTFILHVINRKLYDGSYMINIEKNKLFASVKANWMLRSLIESDDMMQMSSEPRNQFRVIDKDVRQFHRYLIPQQAVLQTYQGSCVSSV